MVYFVDKYAFIIIIFLLFQAAVRFFFFLCFKIRALLITKFLQLR